MNYIDLINQFWRIRRSKRITGNQADVYYCLLQECNERGWENPFEFPNMSICARIGISEPTLIDARARLKQLGLIEFEAGERKVKSPVYEILSLNNLSKTLSINRAKTKDKPSKKVNILNKTKHKLNDNTPKPPIGDLPPETKFDFIDELVKCFADKYTEIRGLKYEVTNKGKERSAAAKILKIYKGKYPEADTEETIKGMGLFFTQCLNISDNWLNQNMSLPTIINKFNEINNILRNGNKRKDNNKPNSPTTKPEGIGEPTYL